LSINSAYIEVKGSVEAITVFTSGEILRLPWDPHVILRDPFNVCKEEELIREGVELGGRPVSQPFLLRKRKRKTLLRREEKRGTGRRRVIFNMLDPGKKKVVRGLPTVAADPPYFQFVGRKTSGKKKKEAGPSSFLEETKGKAIANT